MAIGRCRPAPGARSTPARCRPTCSTPGHRAVRRAAGAALATPGDARNRVLVALERNLVPGFAVTSPSPDGDADPVSDGEIGEIVVDPEHRRPGTARACSRRASTPCAPTASPAPTCWLTAGDDAASRAADLGGLGRGRRPPRAGPAGDGAVRVKQVRLHTDICEPRRTTAGRRSRTDNGRFDACRVRVGRWWPAEASSGRNGTRDGRDVNSSLGTRTSPPALPLVHGPTLAAQRHGPRRLRRRPVPRPGHRPAVDRRARRGAAGSSASASGLWNTPWSEHPREPGQPGTVRPTRTWSPWRTRCSTWREARRGGAARRRTSTPACRST